MGSHHYDVDFLLYKGDYDEALLYYQKALKIEYRVFGVDENHVETQGNSSIADSLHNIGVVYQIKGDYDEALLYYQKSLKIKYRVFGVDESQVDKNNVNHPSIQNTKRAIDFCTNHISELDEQQDLDSSLSIIFEMGVNQDKEKKKLLSLFLLLLLLLLLLILVIIIKI